MATKGLIDQSPSSADLVDTSAGQVSLPIQYRDACMMAAFYRVDAEKAARRLASTAFSPLTIAGKALAVLCAFEYRDTTIGAYNEVGLALWVKLSGTRPSVLRLMLDPRKQEEQACLILNLPVTTEIAWAGGRELWSYPKYIAEIRTDFGPEWAEAELAGELNLRLERRRGLTLKGMPLVIFSVHHGRLLRTTVEVDHRVTWARGAAAQLTVLGAGPTADTIRDLGMEGLPATAVYWTDQMRSTLPLGKDLGPVKEVSHDNVQSA